MAITTPPLTEEEVKGTVATALTQPTTELPQEAIQVATPQEVKPEEMITPETGQMAEVAPISPVTAEAAQVSAPATISAETVTPAEATAAQLEAVKGELSDRSIITDPVTGELRPASLAEAAVEAAPPEAFVKNQLEALFTGMEGGQVPAWAKPAVAAAEAQLAQRGIGNSSVARDSLYNAVIQSALPIAQGDAATAQQTFLANLNNKQQAVMFNAAQQANMDMANLDYLQKAQVLNAQSFLQLDFANMNNEQRSAEINQQAQQQAMLSNQSAENAAKQFNAASENQTRQFMASLQTQIEEQNAARAQATSQFNAGQVNAINQYNTQLAYQREQFNTANALAIEQSNVEWRRKVNTVNTANVNAVNQANAMNAFNLSNQAMTFLWQEYRDNAQWAWQSAENDAERATRLAIAAAGNEAAVDRQEAAMWGEIGSAAISILSNW